MARPLILALPLMGTILMATVVQAATADESPTGTNGPNMPVANEVVPSDIRAPEPTATGSTWDRDDHPDRSGVRSRWYGIHPNPPATTAR